MSYLGKRASAERSLYQPPKRLASRDSGLPYGYLGTSDAYGDMAEPRGSTTAFRYLCPVEQVGAVIGRGGSIIKSLREETGAKITLLDGAAGAKEREVYVSCRDPVPLEDREDDSIQPSGAQVALLKIHEKVSGQDPTAETPPAGSAMEVDPLNNTCRLLVHGSQVGPLLGRGGSVISSMRQESGAHIRLLGKEALPAFAHADDDLLQISGEYSVVHKALELILFRLRAHPPRDAPSGSPRVSGMPGMPGLPGYTTTSPGSGPRMAHQLPPPFALNLVSADALTAASAAAAAGAGIGYSAAALGQTMEVKLRVLCPMDKVGQIIGKGGSHVKQIQQETGSTVLVLDEVEGCQERVVSISCKESPAVTQSGAEEALLRVVVRLVDDTQGGARGAGAREAMAEDGAGRTTPTVRLLVHKGTTGAILGKGGSNVSQIRQSSGAQIRILTERGDAPLCAEEDDHVVQISGEVYSLAVALRLICAQLRSRLLSGGAPPGSKSLNGSHSSHARSGAVGSMGLDSQVGPSSVPSVSLGVNNLQQAAGGGTTVLLSVPAQLAGAVIGKAGANVAQIRSISGARVQLQDLVRGASERIVEVTGTPEQVQAAQALVQAFVLRGNAVG